MEENKITKEELDTILDFQNRLYMLATDVGVLESQKHEVLHIFSKLNFEQEEYKKVLEDKYGKITIDLKDGNFTKAKEDEQSNKKD
tara:strand:+ start:252 stop:509 length:258 start_codon:yes stop_codon:yes gene_type:complete